MEMAMINRLVHFPLQEKGMLQRSAIRMPSFGRLPACAACPITLLIRRTGRRATESGTFRAAALSPAHAEPPTHTHKYRMRTEARTERVCVRDKMHFARKF